MLNFTHKLLILSMRLTFALLVLLINPALIYSQDRITLSDKHLEYVFARNNIKIYKDSSGRLTYKEVLNQKFNLDRVDFSTNDWKTSNHWIRFSIKNNSNNNQWLLEVLDFGIQKITFYDIKTDSFEEAGYMEPFYKRSYHHKNFVYDIDVPIGEERTFLIKTSSATAFGPVMKIHSHKTFFSYSNNEYLLLGFYYGLLILIASYNFFLFISLKDKSHLFYVFYVFCIGLKSLQGDGLGFQYLWYSFPQVNLLLYIAPQLLLISFSAYAIYFLELRKNHKKYYRIILFSLLFYFSLFLIDIFFPIQYLLIVYLITFIIIYSVSVLVYRQGYKPARFFVLGYSLLIVGQIAYNFFLTSSMYGIYLQNEIIILLLVYSINIGFVIEVYIFSMAMADKIKLFKKETEKAQQQIIDQLKINEELKDKVNKELEQKVVERTSELEKTKTKLQEQAEIINRMNLMLDKENFSLKSDMKEINKERGLLKALTFEEFFQTFPDENSCYRFIEELKWGNGYTCKKCNNDKFTKSTSLFSRKCTRCDYIETIKANTIFHNVKFPIEKAFGLIYLTLSSEGEVSTYELADKLKLQQKTCWSFRQKILERIKKEHISKKDLLERGWSILISKQEE